MTPTDLLWASMILALMFAAAAFWVNRDEGGLA